jgi:hypothetical protein
MRVKSTHETSVRYLVPSTKRFYEKLALDNAKKQFYELLTQETNRPTLDTSTKENYK